MTEVSISAYQLKWRTHLHCLTKFFMLTFLWYLVVVNTS